jgi:hypothetical protein
MMSDSIRTPPSQGDAIYRSDDGSERISLGRIGRRAARKQQALVEPSDTDQHQALALTYLTLEVRTLRHGPVLTGAFMSSVEFHSGG